MARCSFFQIIKLNVRVFDIKYSYELLFTPLNFLTTNEHISQVDNLRVRDYTRCDLYIAPLVLSIEATMFNATIVGVIKRINS